MCQITKFFIFSSLLMALVMGCERNTPVVTGPEKAVAVRTAKVTAGEKSYSLRYSGTIEASQTIPLTFQSAGTIQKICVEVGDVVQKGQLLASVDNTDMLNIYNASLARHEQAQDAYNRLKSVHDQGSLPEIKWIEMETNLQQAKSALEISRNNLEKCDMRAPVYGIVGRRNIEPGQSALGTSLSPIELVRIESVYVKVAVPENEISKITKGQKSTFSVLALNGKQFEGTVTNVSPVADAISRTYAVKITAKNPDYELKPGMVCDAVLHLEKETPALLVPSNAVSKDSNGKPFVYILTDDGRRARKQNIEVGSCHETGIEVLAGLSLNQAIVVEGKEKLSDNSLISQ